MSQEVSFTRSRPIAPTHDDDTFSSGGEAPADIATLRAAKEAWRRNVVAPSEAKMPPRQSRFATWSDLELGDVYTPGDVRIDHAKDLGLPGEYPFTRGVQPTMYREPPLDDAHVRGLRHARADQRALPVPARARADGPLDRLRFPDPHGLRQRLARARWARSACAASRSTRSATWRSCSTGIPLDKVTTSMTINGPAIVLLAFYVALADMRGIAREDDRRHRPERLPEGVHRAARLARPAAAGDAHRDRHDRVLLEGSPALEHGQHQRLPHSRGRERRRRRSSPSRSPTASATSRAASQRGLDVDDFAPRLSFFFDVHNDFFEEIAKFRAARRMWARIMKERFGAKKRRVA